MEWKVTKWANICNLSLHWKLFEREEAIWESIFRDHTHVKKRKSQEEEIRTFLTAHIQLSRNTLWFYTQALFSFVVLLDLFLICTLHAVDDKKSRLIVPHRPAVYQSLRSPEHQIDKDHVTTIDWPSGGLALSCILHRRKRWNINWAHCNENPIYVFLFWELRPQSQFLLSCVCQRFIYTQDRSTYFPAAE